MHRFETGQVWSYNTREGEENSFLVIVATEDHPKLGPIINIYVGGLQLRNSLAESGITDVISHLPYAKEALENSVVELLGYTDTLPEYEEGYASWKEAFDEGKAGIFTIPLAGVIEGMQKALEP